MNRYRNRYRFLLDLILEHKSSYALGIVMVGLTLGLTLAIPQYLEQAIDILRSDPDPHNRDFLNRIYWILAFAALIMLTRTASRLLFFIPGRRVEFDLKNRLLTHLTTLQRDYYQSNPTGSIISRVNNDINGVRMLMGFGLLQFTNSIAMLSMAPYLMYEISPRLTLYAALPIVLAFILLQSAIRKLRRLQQAQMKAMQDISDFTVESYNGLDVLRSYRALGWAERSFSVLSDRVKDSAIRMSTIRAFYMPILTHVINALKVLLILYGGTMVIQAEISMGEFMAYTLYLTMLLPPLMGMTFMMFVLQRGFTALGSLETVFNTAPALPAVDAAAEARLPQRLQHGLRVEGLNYAYPDASDRPVLNDIALTVAPAEIVGVFGPIGSGKSTLVNLINRYLTPPADSVYLDGVDVTKLSLARLREHVITVAQEPFLFSDSIRENIRFAAGDTPDDAIQSAAATAALQDDLTRFPAGLDTLVGEKGITLSGGQKQRIALARSLLKPCDLLVLDDVMSAVDHETERYLINQIYGFRHARSLLIVSHRVSVLERAHRIVVLENGCVSAVGTHAELIRREGVYRSAYRLQTETDQAES